MRLCNVPVSFLLFSLVVAVAAVGENGDAGPSPSAAGGRSNTTAAPVPMQLISSTSTLDAVGMKHDSQHAPNAEDHSEEELKRAASALNVEPTTAVQEQPRQQEKDDDAATLVVSNATASNQRSAVGSGILGLEIAAILVASATVETMVVKRVLSAKKRNEEVKNQMLMQDLLYNDMDYAAM